jgi:hypothetical protein
MPQPDASQLHINVALADVSVAFQQDAGLYIADKIFRTVPVDKQSNLYWSYGLGDWTRGQADVRAPGTESAGGGYDVTSAPYYCTKLAVHKDIDEDTMAGADAAFNLESDATEWVTEQLLLKREVDFINAYFKTGVWGGANGGVAGADVAGQAGTSVRTIGSGAAQYWNLSTSDPIGDIAYWSAIMGGMTGKKPNVLAIGALVLPVLLNHPQILDRIKYTGGGGFTTIDILAQVFNVDRVVVASAVQNTAGKGVADNIGYILGKHALLVYAEPNPGLLKASGGYIFTWSGLLGAGAYGVRIKSWYMDEIASTRIEGETAYDMHVIAPSLGTFFNGIVQ